MAFLFWTCVAIIGYVYAGYPLLLLLVNALGGRRRVAQAAIEPKVTLIVSAFNEAEVIAAKIRNSLELDYPRERLQVLVVSDASDDGTDQVVEQFAAQGVELLRMSERGGKTLGLNAAVQRAAGEILVFSDANAMYAGDALRKLTRNFADPQVGAVVGESGYTDVNSASERSEGLYWKYETLIKELETRLGSVVGGDGAIYAIRRSLYQPMRADALSDFVNPLQITRNGHRCVYEREARCYEEAADSFRKEFRRKVRIVNRAWRALFSMRGLLNPLRYGFFAVELLSHKVLRWLVPIFMAVALLSNIALLNDGPLYVATMTLQLLFYALSIIGWRLQAHPGMPRIFSVPYYFCLVNLASAVGIVDAFRGRTYTTWATSRAS